MLIAFHRKLRKIELVVGGDIEEFVVSKELMSLPRVDQISDFHCVTTWSKLDLHWSGYRFKDFYDTLVLPKSTTPLSFVVLKAQDGYKTCLPLSDLLSQDVLLADKLDNVRLSIDHGAPIRIVAPKHYGYKSLKHIKRIEFYKEKKVIKKGILRFMDHPRARAYQEERVLKGPGIIFRWLYKLTINRTIRIFREASKFYKSE